MQVHGNLSYQVVKFYGEGESVSRLVSFLVASFLIPYSLFQPLLLGAIRYKLYMLLCPTQQLKPSSRR